MNSRKAALYLILVSLVAAAAMLISSALLADSDSAETVMFIIIAIWFVPFVWLSGRAVSKKSAEDEQS